MSIRATTLAQRLNDRVTFRRPVLDDNGDAVDWSAPLVRNMRCAVDGMKASGAERVVADGTRSVAAVTVWARADEVERFGINVTCRGEWTQFGCLYYLDVKDMPPQGRQGRLLALICELGVNKG